MKTNTLKTEYAHLLNDQTLCCDLTESQITGHHDLYDLATEDGHASLKSCLNDGNRWGDTVAEVAADLIGDGNEISDDDVGMKEPTEWIYEVPIFDGALKNWRVLNLNTGTFYFLNYDSEEDAASSIEDGEIRLGRVVKRLSREEILDYLDTVL